MDTTNGMARPASITAFRGAKHGPRSGGTTVKIFMWLVVFLASTAATCSQAPPGGEVDQVWAQREAQWIHATKSFDQKELLGAAAFFEEVTGIKSHLEVTYLGVLPTEAEDSMQIWREWFKENRRLLYFNRRTGKIEKLRVAGEDG